MLVLFVYLTGILWGLNFFLVLSALLFGAGSLVFTGFEVVDGDEQAAKPAKFCRKAAYISVPLALLVPSKDTALQMAAAYGVTEAYEVASQSEDVKRLAGKSLELLEKHMDEALKED